MVANFAGTLVAALLCSFTPVLTPELKPAMLDISQHILDHSWIEMLFRAIASGFLIAAMVWLLPSAEAAQFHVIVLITYLIAAAGFMHIVAGSMEAFFLVLNGEFGVLPMFADFFVAGPDRQRRRRHRVVCVDCLCAGHEGDLSGRSFKRATGQARSAGAHQARGLALAGRRQRSIDLGEHPQREAEHGGIGLAADASFLTRPSTCHLAWAPSLKKITSPGP